MHSRISVLGTWDLRSDEGARIQSVLQQPRRFALLIHLALVSREGPVRRDAVLGVFWANKPQDKARNALNQAVHYLRRSLGDNAILTTTETIRLNPELVSSDVADFLAACDAGEHEAALDLYGGTLLPGYYDNSESVDFEHWLETTREALARKASACAWHLAETAVEAGESADAVVWARRAAKANANNEVLVRRLMEFLAELGDRAGVLETYQTLVADLSGLEVEPDAETKALLERLKAEWSRESSEAATSAQPGAKVARTGAAKAAVLSTREPKPLLTKPHSSRIRRVRLGVVALMLIALLAVLGDGIRSRRGHPAATGSGATIIVGPLDAESSLPIAAGALTNEIVTYLGQMTALHVVDGTSYTTGQVTQNGFIVRGGLVRSGDSLIANVQLLDAESDRALATETFERSEPDSIATLNELGRAIAYFTQRSVGAALEQRRIENAWAPSRAKTLVQLGRSDMVTADSLLGNGVLGAGQTGVEKADSMFELATTLAPNWDEPWVERARAAEDLTDLAPLTTKGDGLARARRMAEQGIWYSDKALKHDPKSVDALEEKAMLTWKLWLFDQPDPTDKYAPLLREAENDVREVTSKSPYRARSWGLLGSILLQQGEWDDAYWALRRAVSADTYMENNIEIVSDLFTAAWETHNPAGARDWCEVLQDRLGTSWPSVHCAMTLAATDTTGIDTMQIQHFRATLASKPGWQQTRAEFDALAAVLYARHGSRQRARELLEDPPGADVADLFYLQAWAWLTLGDRRRAQALLNRYVSAAPAARSGILRSRRFTLLTKPSRS